jgi:hypothetical protein
MRPLSEDDTAAARLVLRRFLHADTAGCDFVGHFAHKGEGIFWFALGGRPNAGAAAVLSTLVEQAQANNEIAGLIFPNVATDVELVELLKAFDDSDRWAVQRESMSRNGRDVDVIRMCWLRSTTKERSSVLGMAPLFSMPVTRRAPYVSMFVWPGDRSNPFRRMRFPGNRSPQVLSRRTLSETQGSCAP